jgi:hypothetical protein
MVTMAFHIMSTQIEWLDEGHRPVTGDILMIPANDHLWMITGPGLDLKKAHGKEIELDAVRLGPLEAGGLGVTAGGPTGYRWLYHAVVTGQDHAWVPGAGQKAVRAAVERANREKATSMVVFPLYRGLQGRREEPAREMLDGLLEALQEACSLRTVSVLYGQAEEKQLLHETFLRLLGGAH